MLTGPSGTGLFYRSVESRSESTLPSPESSSKSSVSNGIASALNSCSSALNLAATAGSPAVEDRHVCTSGQACTTAALPQPRLFSLPLGGCSVEVSLNAAVDALSAANLLPCTSTPIFGAEIGSGSIKPITDMISPTGGDKKIPSLAGTAVSPSALRVGLLSHLVKASSLHEKAISSAHFASIPLASTTASYLPPSSF
ncbi:unnamed protein product [Protopolystoma xenopodis]|uniref:Uncharacterized protein n=1 Tax=Protopolystoma xenopodis TaxID=117903 RepID=A0A448X0W0_9PLAT|nr:unnamed protein product [Protopolystoma xenopodis]